MFETQYLVQGYDGEGARMFARVMTAAEIFAKMDMADCDPDLECIELWELNGLGEAPAERTFMEKGYDRHDPQKMCIVGGGHAVYGYGTEH